MKLNSRQHRFVLNLLSGMSQTDAYIKAGYNCNGIGTAAACATDLLKIPKVSEELDRLRQRGVAKITAPLTERLEILAEIARHGIEMPVSAGHKIAAVAEINKVEGSYAPSRHLIGQRVEIEIVHTERKRITDEE